MPHVASSGDAALPKLPDAVPASPLPVSEGPLAGPASTGAVVCVLRSPLDCQWPRDAVADCVEEIGTLHSHNILHNIAGAHMYGGTVTNRSNSSLGTIPSRLSLPAEWLPASASSSLGRLRLRSAPLLLGAVCCLRTPECCAAGMSTAARACTAGDRPMYVAHAP